MESALDAALAQHMILPDWEIARRRLMIAPLPAQTPLMSDQIRRPASPGLTLVIGYEDPQAGLRAHEAAQKAGASWRGPEPWAALSTILHPQCARWGVTEAEIWRAAEDGLEQELAATEIEVSEVGGRPAVHLWPARHWWKASLLWAPGLRARLAPHLGDAPVALAPAAEIALFFPDAASAAGMGRRAAHMAQEMPRGLSAELFALTEEGPRALRDLSQD